MSILIYELSVKLYYLLTHCALHYSVYYTVRARYESLLHSNFLEMYLTVHHSIFLEMYFKLQLQWSIFFMNICLTYLCKYIKYVVPTQKFKTIQKILNQLILLGKYFFNYFFKDNFLNLKI